ncbi:glycine oxidase ThiO [Azospirillum sp. ST 5-10]|uniref:glycine oxidase ThiO n=1 Tax=unclassified Azospirillum TaxID=2630922 RepID=UPI003F4A0C98
MSRGDGPGAASGRPSVAVIGGGIVGLAVGWRLAGAGCRVDVFDAGTAGRGATWAAAGMLAANVEAEPGEQALLPLCRLSQSLWPAFAAELEAASGQAVDLRGEGTLVIAQTADDMARLRHHHAFGRSLGLTLEWLSGAETLRREPHLRPGLGGALFSPEDGQVDNRKVAAALVTAFRRAGGTLHEGRAVAEVTVAGGRATGVVVDGARHPADRVVLAAGAWSRRIPGVPAEALPPVRPVKGQMLALRMDPAAPLLRHVVWTSNTYLVPRRDGRLIVGATVEERGFDERLTAGGVYALLEGVWRAVPGVEELPIDEMWVGFRPGSRDDAPVLGPTPVENLVLATGHHRNGILLAPVTADAVARHVLTGEVEAAIRPFGLDRFAGPRHGRAA